MELSIIIPVYNVVQYLPNCLDSILPQIGQDDEVLLVDDGSSDGSDRILQEYAQKDRRVKVYNQNHEGASAARNKGIKMSKGDWISFVDADDWLEPTYYSAFESIKGKADIVFFPANIVYSNGQVNRRCSYPNYVEGRDKIEQVLYDLKYGQVGDIFGWTWAKFFRASIIREHEVYFVPELVFREDEIFTMDFCKYVSSVEVFDTPLYNYRVVSTGLTSHGLQPKDYLLLSENIDRNLSFFSHDRFVEREKTRLIDYRLDHFRLGVRIRNLHRTIRDCHSFLRRKPMYIKSATNQRMAKMLSHSLAIAYGLVMMNLILEAMLGRLK